MDALPEHLEEEVKTDTKRIVSLDSSNADDKSNTPSEVVRSDHDGENSESMMASVELPVVKAEPDNGKNELPVVSVTTGEDLNSKMNEMSAQLLSHEEEDIFEVNSNDDDEGQPGLHLETPEKETTCSPVEEKPGAVEEKSTTPTDKEDVNYEEYLQLLQDLHEERDKASQHNCMLQMKLAEYLHKKAEDDSELDREMLMDRYKKSINILTDLKQQQATDLETDQQRAEELRRQSQENLDKVSLVRLWILLLLLIVRACKAKNWILPMQKRWKVHTCFVEI